MGKTRVAAVAAAVVLVVGLQHLRTLQLSERLEAAEDLVGLTPDTRTTDLSAQQQFILSP